MHVLGIRVLLIILLTTTLAWTQRITAAQEQDFRKPLDHDVYEIWNSIGGERISNDGQWVLYTVQPGKPDAHGTLKIRDVAGANRWSVVRGASASFTHDSAFAVYLIRPDRDAVRQQRTRLREQKVRDVDVRLPKSKLEIINLATGEVTTIDRVRSYTLPEKAGGWIAYHLEKPIEEPDTEQGAQREEAEEAPAAPPVRQARDQREDRPSESSEKKKDPGTMLVLRNLATGAEYRYEYVTAYEFSEDGSALLFATSVKPAAPADDADEDAHVEAATDPAQRDGVYIIHPETNERRTLLSGLGHYRSLTIDKAGRNFAFLSDRDTYEDDQPEFKLYHYALGMDEARSVAAFERDGLPEGWWVAESGRLRFSESGARLFFASMPRPEPEPKDEDSSDAEEEEEKPVLDIWHWQDDRLQPQQLLQARQDQNRSYQAMVHLDTSRIVQLANEDMYSVSIANKDDGAMAMAATNLPYRLRSSWDTPSYIDVYLIDPATGDRERVLEEKQITSLQLSPQGTYLYWWDGHVRHWFAMHTRTRSVANITQHLLYSVYNELDDTPQIPGSYGIAGWLADDQAVLINDRYDIWLVDPTGSFPPSCVTDGYGRANDLRLRYINLDPDLDHIPDDEPMLLSAFNLRNKQSGFMRDMPRRMQPPTELIISDERFGRPRKADDADTFLLTRETFQIFPDLWVSDAEFAPMQRMSRANPQQEQYRWGTAELTEWRSVDGEVLQGIIYKPDTFDPSRKYPLITYFYERNSDGLHNHVAPAPHRSIINHTFYTSRGYVVFVPDIPYVDGYPGPSAMNAVMPGVLHMIDKGYIDRDRLGVQGHSWGGYQIAYMVTQTDMFRCAAAGAPVSNMISAYGGIRWGTGLSRMFQYEKTQSRIGGTLWDAQQRYIANSPIFWADRINTPLLIMHNDEDGAVPWEQGIELFVALRRLSKPAWLINYNKQPHWPVTWPNRVDWARRMQQYFDHYLMDAPAPVWLAHGVPAVEKGKTLGYELVGAEPEVGLHERMQARKAQRDAKFRELSADVMEMIKTSYLSSIDGMEIPVYVFQPLTRSGNATYPALVWIHGGVHGDLDPENYFPFIAEAVEKGFVVVAPEYRGSTGYGQAHYDAIDYGGYEIDDCLDAVGFIADRLPHVDQQRLGMIGWSHGGYIALLAMTREHEAFKCAAAIVPVSNLVFRLSYKGPGYQRHFVKQERIGGLPHQQRDIYIERSPVYHVDKIQTPMLVHVADNDRDVDFVEAEQLVNALLVKKPDLVETQVYHDPPDGHKFNRRVNWQDGGDYSRNDSEAQIDSWNRIWVFMEKHLSGS